MIAWDIFLFKIFKHGFLICLKISWIKAVFQAVICLFYKLFSHFCFLFEISNVWKKNMTNEPHQTILCMKIRSLVEKYKDSYKCNHYIYSLTFHHFHFNNIFILIHLNIRYKIKSNSLAVFIILRHFLTPTPTPNPLFSNWKMFCYHD